MTQYQPINTGPSKHLGSVSLQTFTMKAVLITCAVLCIFGLAAYQVRADEPVENPITDEQGQCIIDVLSNTDVDTEHVGGMAVDIVETFARLIQHYFRCEEILGNPPTALEQRRHE